ncbi:stemmadenine O-acetyltransferase-like [Solanum dulcamara]|uniref:stemmadenine O-acetyltransferase-like n=1 Tax=Solanum dulcamara TaxID=45834 RepID=UPI0024860A33|nr:stemmadenine O-acetyltransferase-like [Solanum dulcamara]
MMDANKVEIISKEMIKPSLPTPPPLRIHKLSLLDQISPPVFIPLIFFYQNDQLLFHDKLESLKQSLSHALIRFYPLAGRLNNNKYSIDCNDAGVQFIVAQVHGYNLSEFIQTPKMEQLREFLPSVHENDDDDVLLAVQVNLFECDEGIAIGVCMSHKVGDGSSIVTFINSWAAIARGHGGDEDIVQPNFNLASTLFPPIDLSNSSFKPSIGMVKKEKIFTTRRFVFDKKKLDALKKSASSRSLVKNPTRVEALSAFLWKEALKLNKDCNKKLSAAVHAVNIRSRMNNPNISDYFFGNLWTAALAFSEIGGSSSNTDDDLVYKLRNAIRKIDSDYVKMLQNGQDFIKHVGKLVELFSKGEVEFFNFTSWCRFPVYAVDFGWGKPVWVCTTTFPYENMIIFLTTKCGEGIEAWVNMLEDDDDFIGKSLSIIVK